MNTLRKNVLIGLAALSLGSAAFAADVPAQPRQPHEHHAMTPEQRQARMADHIAKREAKLHEALKITPAQEPAWNAFVASMKPAHPGDRAQWASLSAPERMSKHIAMMQARLDALNTFYSTLSPEQKKLMDQHTMHHGGERGEHHWHGQKAPA
jgi:periplasmic protein CpxP/Spy